MLFVLFHVKGECYAIAARDVIEIVPMVRLRVIPKSPGYIAGLLNYRGTGVPVVDLCALFTSESSRVLLSSRLMLVRFRDDKRRDHVLGLLAENITDTVDCDPAEFAACGVSTADTPYLGDIATLRDRIVQRIEVDALLTKAVRENLFR